MTHSDLIDLGRRWLLKGSYSSQTMKRQARAACSVIVTELVTHAIETPDVLGWAGVSVVIECKTTRADFLADQAKEFRKMPENGMGVLRYYLAPEGLLSEEEIPQGWGFLIARTKLPPRRGCEVLNAPGKRDPPSRPCR